METKINIAKILKNKPEGTKLWTDMFGSVTLYVVTDACDAFQVKHHNKEPWFDEDGKLYKEGVLCIYPSKSMRDWEKFSWKKGDVLVSNDSDSHIIFKGFSKDDYTTFEGKHWISVSKKRHISCLNMQNTQNYHIEDNKEFAQTYINTIEERLGGKLNRETLEVEKPQPEFKDGDIVMSDSGTIVLVRGISLTRKIYYHAYMRNEYIYINQVEGEFFSRISRIKRFATDSEKQQLFDALAKEGKRWDIEKKQIVDLKLKWTPKPFDKVVVRCGKADKWSIDFFSYKVSNGYICTGDAWFGYCLPYNEETAHLLGTTDDWEGGEQ